MSAISWHHKIKDYPGPTKSVLLAKIIEGAKRMQVSSPNRVAPIPLTTLYRVLENLHTVLVSPYDLTAYKALFLLSYHAALRAGEVVRSGRFG